MTKTKLALSLESPAYRLFIEELDKHLRHAASFVIAGRLHVSAEQARELGASFHTIRGSAGFFGLAEVATNSQTLEEHLFEVADGGALDACRAATLIGELVDLARNFPRE